MDQAKPLPWFKNPSVAVAVAYIGIFSMVGKFSPACAEIFRGMRLHPSWRVPLINLVTLGWTLPLGLIIATLLIWKDRTPARKISNWLNISALAILFFLFIFWSYAWTGPLPHLVALPEPQTPIH